MVPNHLKSNFINSMSGKMHIHQTAFIVFCYFVLKINRAESHPSCFFTVEASKAKILLADLTEIIIKPPLVSN